MASPTTASTAKWIDPLDPTIMGLECCICKDDDPKREAFRYGLVQTTCQHLFDQICLNQWRLSLEQQRQEPTCPLCRAPLELNDRVLYCLTQEDLDEATKIEEMIQNQKISSLRTRLDELYPPTQEERPPTHYHYTLSSAIRKAAVTNNLIALSIFKDREQLSHADQESLGFRQTALYSAARFDATQACEFLLEHGANPNGTPSGKPLNIALAHGNLRLVELLNSKNVDYAVDERGCTPLISLYLGMLSKQGRWGELKDQSEAIELEKQLVDLCLEKEPLLSHTIAHPLEPKMRASAIHLAALFSRSIEAFEKLVDKAPYLLLHNPVQQLARRAPPIFYRLLILAPPESEEPFRTDPPIFDALSSASETNDFRKFNILASKLNLSAGSGSLRRSGLNFTTLLNETVATVLQVQREKRSHPDFNPIVTLIEQGHQLGEADAVFSSALEAFAIHVQHYQTSDGTASAKAQLDFLRYLKSTSSTILNIVNAQTQRHPLHHYVINHQGDEFSEAIVRALSCNINQSRSERTPDRIECLFAGFANTGDQRGDTPLHYAILANHQGCSNEKLIQDLLLAGADPDKQNNAGVSAKQLSQSHPRGDVLRNILQRTQAYPDSSERDEIFDMMTSQNPTLLKVRKENGRLFTDDPYYARSLWSILTS